MDRMASQPASARLSSLVAPALDLAVLASFIWLIPPLVARLAEQHWVNAVLIATAYFAMCGGVLVLKLIEPTAGRQTIEEQASAPHGTELDNQVQTKPSRSQWTPEDTRGCTTTLSVFFGLFVASLVVDGSGLFSSESPWSVRFEQIVREQSWVTLPLALAILLVAFALPIIVLISPRPRISPSSFAGVAAKAAGVLAVDAMVLVTAAYWEALTMGSEPLELALGGRILVFVVIYVVFVLFYAPPRLILLSIDPSPWSLPTFLVMLGVVVWRLLF